jgi:hypothetical protein
MWGMRHSSASTAGSPLSHRRNHYDVTDRVCISNPAEVCAAVGGIFQARYPGIALQALDHAFTTFGELYAGWLPGYFGCDTWYHDAQHSLDCALAMARLLDGHGRAAPCWAWSSPCSMTPAISAMPATPPATAPNSP